MRFQEKESLCVELSEATLTRLLAEGHLGASELRCLDRASGQLLRRLCLKSCVWRKAGGGCNAPGRCPMKCEGAKC
jgi:hypothetical protein